MRTLIPLAMLFVCAFALPADVGSAAAPEWPQWRGPHRNGVSLEKDWAAHWPAEGPKRLWKVPVGTGFSSVSVNRGRLYTMGNIANEDIITCLNTENGEVVWQHKYACPLNPNAHLGGPNCTPTIDGALLYTFSKSGHVFCLDAAMGKALWTRDISQEPAVKAPLWNFAGSPLILEHRLFLNVGRAGIALDKRTGDVLWKSGDGPGYGKGGPSGYASPIAFTYGARTCIAFFASNALRAVDPASGELLWEYPYATNFGENTPDPLIIGEQILISSGHGLGATLLKIDGGKPVPVWKNEKFGNHIASSVMVDGFLFGFDGRVNKEGGSLNCVDATTGELKWSKSGIKGSLTAAAGKLVILTLDGTLISAVASAVEYKEISRVQALGGKCWTMPVLAGGKIYVRSGQGELACFDVRQ